MDAWVVFFVMYDIVLYYARIWRSLSNVYRRDTCLVGLVGVEFNAPLDTIEVISEAVFTDNHLWLMLTNKTVQENTDKETQWKSEKVDNLKYRKTKLSWFSCVLQHSARKRGGLILQRSEPTRGRDTCVASITFTPPAGHAYREIYRVGAKKRGHILLTIVGHVMSCHVKS